MHPEPYKYADITGKIIGAAIEVHKTLGCGFQEVIYQRSLGVEMEKVGLIFSRELEMPIYYKTVHVGTRRVDFLVADKILVELKAVSDINDTHLAQAINYIEAYQMEIGLLINFGSKSLQFKRLINNKYVYNREENKLLRK